MLDFLPLVALLGTAVGLSAPELTISAASTRTISLSPPAKWVARRESASPPERATRRTAATWETGFALIACGGIATSRIVGETDRYADRANGKPFTPQNLLGTLYHLLGIDAAATVPTPGVPNSFSLVASASTSCFEIDGSAKERECRST